MTISFSNKRTPKPAPIDHSKFPIGDVPKSIKTFDQIENANATQFSQKIGRLYRFGSILAIYVGKYENNKDVFITTTNLLNKKRTVFSNQAQFPQDSSNINQWLPITPTIADFCIKQFKQYPSKYELSKKNGLITNEALWTNTIEDNKVKVVSLSTSNDPQKNHITYVDINNLQQKYYGGYMLIRQDPTEKKITIGDTRYIDDTRVWYLGRILRQNSLRYGFYIFGYMPILPEDTEIGFHPRTHSLSFPDLFTIPDYTIMHNIGMNIGEFKYKNANFRRLVSNDFFNKGNRLFWTKSVSSNGEVKCYDGLLKTYIMTNINSTEATQNNVLAYRAVSPKEAIELRLISSTQEEN